MTANNAVGTEEMSGADMPPVVRDLTFDRTAPRSLVHRSSIAEVFVTEGVVLDDRRCVVGAQLPLCHGFYDDRVEPPARFDELLLLECCRQGAIFGSHLAAGVSLGTAMVVKSFRLTITDAQALVGTGDPGELVMDTRYDGRPTRSGRVRNARVDQTLHLDGLPVGHHEMELTIVRDSEIAALRSMQRGSPAPSTSDLAGQPPAVPRTAAAGVGRFDPRNVVLGEPERTAGGVRARVVPDFANRALFDHAYDHLPAMVLTEAARQLARLAVGTGSVVTGLGARLGSPAELDEPLYASAPVDRTGRTDHVEVALEQCGRGVADIRVDVRRAGARVPTIERSIR